MRFEWDKRKANSNVAKHQVSFEDAATVFGDPLSLTIYDPDHSSPDESRLLILGSCHQGNLLVVSFTEREDWIRIISARKATRKERRDYENE